jgi:hypothetical protein
MRLMNSSRDVVCLRLLQSWHAAVRLLQSLDPFEAIGMM